MRHTALDERHALAQTLRRADPDAPTLCGDWTTAQLAAHLVLRERSIVDAGRFLPVPALARRAEQGVEALAADTPYADLVDLVDRGPSWRDVWGPVPVAWAWSLPAVREQANVIEYVVHHEDVRRAAAQWEPRNLSVATQRTVWQRLKIVSRTTLRHLPLGVRLQWAAHGEIDSRLVRPGAPSVTVSGAPVELALFALGRAAVAQIDYAGPPADVEVVRASELHF